MFIEKIVYFFDGIGTTSNLLQEIRNFYYREPRCLQLKVQYPLINLCLRNQQNILKSDYIGLNCRNHSMKLGNQSLEGQLGLPSTEHFPYLRCFGFVTLNIGMGTCSLWLEFFFFFNNCLFLNLSNNPLLLTAL